MAGPHGRWVAGMETWTWTAVLTAVHCLSLGKIFRYLDTLFAASGKIALSIYFDLAKP